MATSVADHAELKHLQRRLDESRASVKALRDEKQALDEKINKEQGTINKLQKDIERIKSAAQSNGKLVVSEHALLRYFERVMGFNLEEIKKRIVPESVSNAIKTVGSGTFPTETHRLKVKDGVVITILTDDEQ